MRLAVAVGAAVVAAIAPRVHADPWQAETEAGVEYDSNVGRVEQRLAPAAAPLMRASARLDAKGGDVDRMRWGLSLVGGARAVLSGSIDTEDAVTGAVDVTATRRAGDHLAIGARATHYEVWPIDNPMAPRAFASSGADLSVAIADDAGRRAVISVGARRLVYKPDPDFDWTGPAIGIVLEDPLWRGADDRAIDLAAGYRLERRGYRGLAYQNSCAPDEEPDTGCYAPGDRARADLVHVASVRATYTGARVASLGYELLVDDSTSFGSSLVRQRVTASITAPLPAKIFATATLTGQLDHYPEPQIVATDIELSYDDESRSGAAVRLARALGAAWQLEVRWAIQATALADEATTFRRQLVYAGVTWER